MFPLHLLFSWLEIFPQLLLCTPCSNLSSLRWKHNNMHCCLLNNLLLLLYWIEVHCNWIVQWWVGTATCDLMLRLRLRWLIYDCLGHVCKPSVDWHFFGWDSQSVRIFFFLDNGLANCSVHLWNSDSVRYRTGFQPCSAQNVLPCFDPECDVEL